MPSESGIRDRDQAPSAHEARPSRISGKELERDHHFSVFIVEGTIYKGLSGAGMALDRP